ncbi:hypothetical protein FA13DRAFT_1741684, partial [Coprinellus micaceus]
MLSDLVSTTHIELKPSARSTIGGGSKDKLLTPRWGELFTVAKYLELRVGRDPTGDREPRWWLYVGDVRRSSPHLVLIVLV